MRFHLYPLSRVFSNRYVFDENAQHFSVDRRPKRIEMYAFSNENALVWTGPKSPSLVGIATCFEQLICAFRQICW